MKKDYSFSRIEIRLNVCYQNKRTSAMTCEPMCSLRRFTSCVRIIESSARSAAFVIFTQSVWLWINRCWVYFATVGPVTSGHASMSRRCSSGVSNPVKRRYCLTRSSTGFTSFLNIFKTTQRAQNNRDYQLRLVVKKTNCQYKYFIFNL